MSRLERTAMGVAAVVIGVAGLYVLIFPDQATRLIGGATAWSMAVLGTPVLWLSTGLLLLCFWLILGPWGRLRLGAEDEAPEFGLLSWVSMLFAAGMGSGLVFWGVAEPLMHFASPPVPGLDEAGRVRMALAVTNFHWGLHAWAIYAIAGLVVAWFAYRHAAPETPSGALDVGLRGWIPNPARRWIGIVANVLATGAVVFGVGGSLANGTILLHTGLDRMTPGELPSMASYAVILVAMTLAFLASASSGLSRGIRWLSVTNFLLAIVLLVLLLAVTGVDAAWTALVDGSLEYLRMLPAWSLAPLEVNGSRAWAEGWTITYLLWWIAWAPFVGIFIARISRGRTVRAYVLGVLGVPVVFSIIWFAVLGGGATAFDRANDGVLSAAVLLDYTEPVFLWFDTMGSAAGVFFGWVSCVLLFVFLVTSADSAAYVLGMLAHHGNPEPPNRSKLLWGSMTVVLAAGLLARDSADVIKSVAIAGAIPYASLLVIQLVAWWRSAALHVREAA
ncbi:BCCT family transporter [Elongatibacter sediminis]|uniref:BCCT family transporter n=1 Tax=Elongatibacter sediminis TaxID=3119006 RepID=A0AAW9RGB7_9GAMM